MTQHYGLSDEMFDDQRVKFHAFEGNKNGSPAEHKFRVLPPYAPKKLFHKVGLHWGFKSADGKNKALVCLLETVGSCPICLSMEKVKGEIENIDAALKTCVDLNERQRLEADKAQKEEYMGEHRRKPMYLWNILTENGEQKVLQLSWNGHDPLHEKIKFWWTQKRIDVTSPEKNYLMYCNRSGLKAKTRYAYEVLEGTERNLDSLTLTNLEKIYVPKSAAYLNKVLESGIVPQDDEDLNNRSFESAPSNQGQSSAQSNQQSNVQTNQSTTAQTNQQNSVQTNQQSNVQSNQQSTAQSAQTTVGNQTTTNVAVNNEAPKTQEQAPQGGQVQLSQEQDAEIAQMMAALQN